MRLFHQRPFSFHSSIEKSIDLRRGGERTCRTDADIRRRDQYPCVWGEREAEVGDRGEAIGVEGGETECWTPGVEFERHGWVGG